MILRHFPPLSSVISPVKFRTMKPEISLGRPGLKRFRFRSPLRFPNGSRRKRYRKRILPKRYRSRSGNLKRSQLSRRPRRLRIRSPKKKFTGRCPMKNYQRSSLKQYIKRAARKSCESKKKLSFAESFFHGRGLPAYPHGVYRRFMMTRSPAALKKAMALSRESSEPFSAQTALINSSLP